MLPQQTGPVVPHQPAQRLQRRGDRGPAAVIIFSLALQDLQLEQRREEGPQRAWCVVLCCVSYIAMGETTA